MDALAGLLGGPRTQGAFLLRALLSPPWSLRVQDGAPVTLMCLTRGEAWVVPHGGAPVRLAPGDIAVARGPEPYVVADDPATGPEMVIHPGQRATTVDGEELCADLDLGVRTWGTDPEGPTALLIGSYEHAAAVGAPLLRALPPLVVLRAGEWTCPFAPLLDEEVSRDEPGQSVVLDRMFDLLLISALRAWFARPDAEAPAWYRAYGDQVVGRALRLLQAHPEHPWTVAALAEKAGASRAALSRRFTALVGEPPMSYLTHWRLDLAADLLRDPSATLDAIARQVGYGSGFALSTAFKRVRGASPQEYRSAMP